MKPFIWGVIGGFAMAIAVSQAIVSLTQPGGPASLAIGIICGVLGCNLGPLVALKIADRRKRQS